MPVGATPGAEGADADGEPGTGAAVEATGIVALPKGAEGPTGGGIGAPDGATGAADVTTGLETVVGTTAGAVLENFVS